MIKQVYFQMFVPVSHFDNITTFVTREYFTSNYGFLVLGVRVTTIDVCILVFLEISFLMNFECFLVSILGQL